MERGQRLSRIQDGDRKIGGSYCLFCDTKRVSPAPLTTPRAFTYRLIADKHIGSEILHGVLTAISDTGAVITTDSGFGAFDEIVINASLTEPIYCKVLRPEKEGWYVRFTSVPEDISELLE